jgi:hypothetical protein
MSAYRDDYSTLERKLQNSYTQLTKDKNIVLNNDFQMDVYDWGVSEYFVKSAKEIKNGIIQTDEDQDEEQTEFNELCILSRISLIEELETIK